MGQKHLEISPTIVTPIPEVTVEMKLTLARTSLPAFGPVVERWAMNSCIVGLARGQFMGETQLMKLSVIWLKLGHRDTGVCLRFEEIVLLPAFFIFHAKSHRKFIVNLISSQQKLFGKRYISL